VGSTSRESDHATRRPLLLALAASSRAGDEAFRPPAVLLIVQDPYVSCWSFSDRLTDD
jgi:hypothetical protein